MLTGLGKLTGSDGTFSKPSTPRVYGELLKNTRQNPSAVRNGAKNPLKQPKFRFVAAKTIPKTVLNFDLRNLENAHYILQNPSVWGGLDGFGCRWARMVLERLAVKAAA